MDLPKSKVLTKAFVTSQFNYCPLIWMLHSRTLNYRLSNTHESALKLKYKDNQSSFEDHSVTVHHKSIQVLVTEMFKDKNDSASDIMKDVFGLKKSSIKPTGRIK